jgi:hypothetical protein
VQTLPAEAAGYAVTLTGSTRSVGKDFGTTRRSRAAEPSAAERSIDQVFLEFADRPLGNWVGDGPGLSQAEQAFAAAVGLLWPSALAARPRTTSAQRRRSNRLSR